MANIRVTNRDGSRVRVDVPTGNTLMEGLRAGGILDIEGICGGYALCGTCHVYVDAANRARLPEQGDDELTLLEGLMTANENSRLMCQVTCTAELADLEVTVAPRD